jgi:hypothetical protein
MTLSYKQCIDEIADLKEKALELYDSSKITSYSNQKTSCLLALILVIEAEQARFSMLKEGPAVMALKTMEEQLN